MSKAIIKSAGLNKEQRTAIALEKRALAQEGDSLQVRLINSLMLCRNLESRAIDEICGFVPGTFTALRTKDFPSEGVRAKIERALSCRVWCDERTWHLREACFRRYGFDPSLLEKAELKSWIARLGIQHRVPPGADRAALVETVLAYFAANPND